MIEKKSRGIESPTIKSWYWETTAENTVEPLPAIIERKNAAAQVGHPANKPNEAPNAPPANFLPEAGDDVPGTVLVCLIDEYNRDTFRPTSTETKIIVRIEMGINCSPRCWAGKYTSP